MNTPFHTLLAKRPLVAFTEDIAKLTSSWLPAGVNIQISDGNIVDIKDIWFKFENIKEDVFKRDWFTSYPWQEFDTLEKVSKTSYGDESYWWTIFLVSNKINPIFDFPLWTSEIDNLTNILLSEKKGNFLKHRDSILKRIMPALVEFLFERHIDNLFNDPFNQWKEENPGAFRNEIHEKEKEIKEEAEFFLKDQINKNFDYVTEPDGYIETSILGRDPLPLLSLFYEEIFGFLKIELENENDNKRNIQIVKPLWLKDFISLVERLIKIPPKRETFYNYIRNV